MIPLLAPLPFLLGQAPQPAPLVYRFETVRHAVHLWPGGDARRARPAAAGDSARSGDVVQTGWWGRAVITVPARASRFEIFPSTRVRLAADEPGVLLVLERGRLKALFEALAGGPVERRVGVPGALLAVRGTRYGVEVDKAGRSTLVVFKGVVEVIPQSSQLPHLQVRAGQWADFGPGLAPRVLPMPRAGFDEHGWDRGMRPDGAMGLGSMPDGAMPGGMRPGPMH